MIILFNIKHDWDMKMCYIVGMTQIQSGAAQHLIGKSSKGLIITHLLLPFFLFFMKLWDKLYK